MTNPFLQFYFLAGLLTGTLIRVWYGRQHRQNEAAELRKEGPLVWFFLALWGIAQILPLIYIFSDWLDFANYELPLWAGWIGVVIFTAGIWLLWRSHVDLGQNWSPTLEIRSGHKLVTAGVYRWIRHPMYAAHLLWAIGQPLLIQNWIAGALALVAIVPMYLLRAPAEEQMMLDQFGNDYRTYMERTGGIVPRLTRR